MTRGRPGATAWLGLLLVLSLALRLGLGLRSHYPSYDGCYYLAQARQLAVEGKVDYSPFPPGWPLLVAPALLVADPAVPEAPLAAAEGVNALLGTLGGWLFFRLARRRHGRWASLALSAGLLLMPLHVRLSCGDLSEIAALAAVLGAWLLATGGRPLAGGLLAGYAYWIRPEALLPFLLLALLEWRERRARGLRLLGGLLLAVALHQLFLAVAGPGLRLSSKWGYLEHAWEGRSAFDFLGLYLRNAGRLLAEGMGLVGPATLALALVALLRRRRRELLLLTPLLLVPLFDFRMDARYWIPWMPALLLAAADGLRQLLVGPGRMRRLVLVGLALGLLLGAYVRALPGVRLNEEAYPTLRQAGLWLRSRGDGSNLLVAGRKPYVAYWAGARFARVPLDAPLPGILDWAQRQGVDVLVVHAGIAAALSPQLLPLIGDPPAELADRLERLESFAREGRPEETVRLYRLR